MRNISIRLFFLLIICLLKYFNYFERASKITYYPTPYFLDIASLMHYHDMQLF